MMILYNFHLNHIGLLSVLIVCFYAFILDLSRAEIFLLMVGAPYRMAEGEMMAG